LGDLNAAAAAYQNALQVAPQAEIHNNLAAVLRDLGQLQMAERHVRDALLLLPDSADAHNNLATLLVDQGHYDKALEHYRRATQQDPASTAFLTNLANAYRQQGATEAAEAAYRRVEELDPADPWNQVRISALCPVTFPSREALQAFHQNTLDQWHGLAERKLRSNLAQISQVATEPSFNFQFLDGNPRPLREAYAKIFRQALDAGSCDRNPGKPRVGVFVSRKHEGIFLKSLRGILERIPAADFETVVVCPHALAGRIRENIHREDAQLISIPERLDLAAEALRACRFDVLYYWETATDAATYFLPFQRLAPVQCTSWGIQVTSGIPAIDYYLSSELVEPQEAQEHYTEKLLLADTLLTYQYPIHAPESPLTRNDFGLADQQHVYVCAQQTGKFHPDFDSVLAGILREDGQGILLITDDRFQNASRLLTPRFRRAMPDVVDRIRFLPHLKSREYLSLILAADVLLDPPHFGGVNSTYDGLAMGKPIVTAPSDFHRGRYTSGCYRRMGISDLVVQNSADYIAKAVQLGSDPDARRDVEGRIRVAKSTLFGDDRAVDEFHRLLVQLVEVARSR
jgi:predicted O-linked N-acetylglucosamine transferase (SPINDLY family)